MNGYNFTERVRKVLLLSRDEASALGCDYVDPAHILIGLLRDGGGVAFAVIEGAGINANDAVARLRNAVRNEGRPMTGPELPYTSDAKRVLEGSMKEARELGHSYVGTEHVLLGLLRGIENEATKLLTGGGVTYEYARTRTLELLGPTPPASMQQANAAVSRPAGKSGELIEVTIVLEVAGANEPIARKFKTITDAIEFLRSTRPG